MSMMKSFTHLMMIPIPHWSSNKFMCIEATDNYIAYRKIYDKLLALTTDGILCTWNILTNRLLSKITLPEYNYSTYMLAKKSRDKQCNRVLIKTKEKIDEEIKDEDFFPAFNFQS